MAGEKIATIDKWLGVRYCPDGDVDLKVGEASEMVNWRVTRTGNLQTRNGYSLKYEAPENEYIEEIWTFKESTGNVAELLKVRHETVEAIPQVSYKIYNTQKQIDTNMWILLYTTNVGERISYHWQWRDMLYFAKYSSLSNVLVGGNINTTLEVKTPYTPVLFVSCEAEFGSGESFEQVNKLTNRVRAWYSPDGETTQFTINSAGFSDVVDVIDRTSGESIAGWTHVDNVVTVPTAPAEGVNTLEIVWTLIEDGSAILKTLCGSELYSGNTDATLFFRCTNSDTIQHLGADYNGVIDTTYFPDYSVSRIGVDNDPVTGFMRHGTSLFVLKHSSAWRVEWGVTTLADGNITESFYVLPVSRNIGSQIDPIMVLNDPISIFGKEIYLWKNGSRYSSTLTFSETISNRISDRVTGFLKNGCYWAVDDNYNQEAWFCIGSNRFLIWNYALDVWYIFEMAHQIDQIVSFFDKNPYILTGEKVYFMSESDTTDAGEMIYARWMSGDMNFGAPYLRKNSRELWVTYRQSGHFYLEVGTYNDRRPEERDKFLESRQFSYRNFNYSNFTYKLNKEPMVKKMKLKNKKFTHMRVTLENDLSGSSATVLLINIKYRLGGDAK